MGVAFLGVELLSADSLSIPPAETAEPTCSMAALLLAPEVLAAAGSQRMDHPDSGVQHLDRIINELQRIRTRRCEPKSNANPSYLALSNAMAGVRKARNDLAAER